MMASRCQIPRVSPGALLREESRAGTEVGRRAEEFTRDGRLVPDDVICDLVHSWLDRNGSEFIFDGFPRSLGQARDLDADLQRRGMALDAVILLEAEISVLFERVMGRLVCTACGKNFSKGADVAAGSTDCPACGGSLGRRNDDSPEVLENRLREYAQSTEPLIAYYEERGLLHRVNANRPQDEVFESVFNFLAS